MHRILIFLVGMIPNFLCTEKARATPIPAPCYVYLTLDDGPLKGSDTLIQLTKTMALPISFMWVGKHIEAHQNLLKNMDFKADEDLIFIGNHSYSHGKNQYKTFYADPEQVVQDFNQNELLLDELISRKTTKLARLPGYNIWQIGGRFRYVKQYAGKAAKQLSNQGYSLIGWDVEWEKNPKNGKPRQSVLEVVKAIEMAQKTAFTPGHVVVLAHDTMFKDTDALQELVLLLREKGYCLQNITAYPGIKKNDEEADSSLESIEEPPTHHRTSPIL